MRVHALHCIISIFIYSCDLHTKGIFKYFESVVLIIYRWMWKIKFILFATIYIISNERTLIIS